MFQALKAIFVTIAIVLLFSCNDEKPGTENPLRPLDPWVFRSVLDSIPRILTIALHDDLWLAYSADDASLYKAWKGNVHFTGTVYNTLHGPQPLSVGDAYFVNEHKDPWAVVTGQNSEQHPEVDYNGHRIEDGEVYLMYDLILDDGTRIGVEENPEYITTDGTQVGLELTFILKNLPPGIRVYRYGNVNSIVMADLIQTDGELEILQRNQLSRGQISGESVHYQLLLNNDHTTLKTFFVDRPFVVKASHSSAAPENIPLGKRLIDKSDCRTCHNTYVATIGPSYVDVAERYATTEANVNTLVKKVVEGGSGVWGEQVMTAHPDLDENTAREMIKYILDLDSDDQGEENRGVVTLDELSFSEADTSLEDGEMSPGLVIRVYEFATPISSVEDLSRGGSADYAGVMSNIRMGTQDFGKLENNFGLVATGFIDIEKDNNFVFRLVSDDGSRLYIDDRLIIDHDGFHGASPMDGEIALREGLHPIRVEYFQGAGGRSLALQWAPHGQGEFTAIPDERLRHHATQRQDISADALPMAGPKKYPGDQYPLTGVHPSFELHQARPEEFTPKVGGMDFLSDGRLVISTWDPAGSVYILENVTADNPEDISYTLIAHGLAEPLGLTVVDDEIYVLQKQELTHLIDHDGDELIDEYRTVTNDWDVSANFHEFAFGLAYKDGFFYGALATAIDPGGASTQPQIPDRGKVIKISKETGELEFVAQGLRTPNGIGIGIDGELFIADNQGDWLPSSKIVHVKEGAFYGGRSVDYDGTEGLPVTQPVVWLPQDEIGNSPSTPLGIMHGPYAGQMIHGEVTHGGIKRVFVEEVGGNYQGCVFRFTQGLEAGVNRMVWGPDSSLYIGGIGSTGNWRHEGTNWFGLQRLEYTGEPTFEMLSVSARSDGMEIIFTEPLKPGMGTTIEEYEVQQWYYKPTAEYGGPKLDERTLPIRSVRVSADRRRVFLELEGMKEQHVVYIHLKEPPVSENNREIWSTEGRYTLNTIPQNRPGFISEEQQQDQHNTLTEAEKEDGWRLLFDGETTEGWHTYGKDRVGSSWQVTPAGELMLDVEAGPDGKTAATDGGDIVTDDEYQNYEFALEWKISPCGNSGIMYNVHEDEQYDFPWQTGPEMQILDNACHPDSRFSNHRAGDLYDMIAVSAQTVKPAGEWNKVRIVNNNGQVEHWLNGRKVVEFEMFTDEWKQLIGNSKFRDMEGFGTYEKGRIALQDHHDRVWFRNIKIKELD